VPDASSRFATGRHAGVLVPLFSIPSREGWGIGEIPDLAHFARWLAACGCDFVQLLPVNEMEEGQSSPYSAMSAMAIDPIFISLGRLDDFREAGGERALAAADRDRLADARAAAAVDYSTVRSIKRTALRMAFDRFLERHWRPGSARAQELRRFQEKAAWWLTDYALFRALHDENGWRSWLDWDEPLRRREPVTIAAARERLADQVLYFEYLQWIADEQWQLVRRECRDVGIFGDFPFMVSSNSADVWARQDEFRVDASVGVPPDAFSETGQDWGLPAYEWDVIARGDYQWLRDRARRCAELYDGFRIDHLVGFYRTFVREADGRTHFIPDNEPAQRAQGEALMRIFASCGSRILAEDLGTVPDFVRESIARLGIAGMKVLRWEREWDVEGKPFRDSADYPIVSVATSGTHDTETVAEWWDAADDTERRLVLDVPLMRERRCPVDVPLSAQTRDALLEALFSARSELVILPMQDIFGWRERINRPASVEDSNWTWRLPWPVEDLPMRPESRERAQFVRGLAQKYGRTRRPAA
jgi:4-alpha-glucanotransferase